MVKKFNEYDWYAYAGATQFKNGEEPFIFRTENSQGIELVLIGDAEGIELSLYTGGEYDPELVWHESMKVPPMKMEGILRHIIKELKLKEDWYAPDLTYTLDHARKLSEV